MKRVWMPFLVVVLFSMAYAVSAQEKASEEEEYQRKLEAWKKQKEMIEKQNQEKLSSVNSQKGAKARFKAGNEYYKQGDYAAAVREFQQAVKLDPEYQKAYTNLGLSYKRLGDFQSAIRNYDIAIKMPNGEKETVTQAISYKANLYIDTKEYKKAVETIDLYLKDDPTDDGMLYLKGKVLKDGLGQLKESIAVLQSAVASNPNNPKAHLELTSCYNVTGDYQLAINHGLKGLEASNDAETTAALNFEVGDAYRKFGNTAEAVKYYQSSKTSRKWREIAEYWLKTLGSK
ncbi:tetratricopeptide repeat protein [bacterium]|nr:tetratricopeptide repeat protein [bacterium]